MSPNLRRDNGGSTLTIIVIGDQLGYEPHLLGVGRHQRGLHGKGARGQHRFAMRQRCIGQDLLCRHRVCGCYWRTSQANYNAQAEAGEEAEKDHNKFTLVHGIHAHVDGSLAAIVKKGR